MIKDIIIPKFKEYFKIDNPIAFFYTNNPPQDCFNPHPKNKKLLNCIIPLLNGVRQGRILVLGRKSFNLCIGGLTYLGFRNLLKGAEYFLSMGISAGNKPNEIFMEGERIKIDHKLAKDFYSNVPFFKTNLKYCVFMPLKIVPLEKYTPELIILFVNMNQLGGLIQLFNYDTNDGTKLGWTSGCGSLITEPIFELRKSSTNPRAIIGLLSDMISRKYVPSELASFTTSYDRILKILPLMDNSFLQKDSWKRILKFL
jgi:uncharacterized protein (DUF169 family)